MTEAKVEELGFLPAHNPMTRNEYEPILSGAMDSEAIRIS